MSTTLNSFRYLRPKSVAEALSLIQQLEEKKDGFVFSSGGTDLVPQLKMQRSFPGTVVSLGSLDEMHQVRLIVGKDSRKYLETGSQLTLAELSTHPEIQQLFPGLAEAARKVASPQIRNRASVAGNLLVNNRCLYFNQSELNRDVHDACFKSGGEVCHVMMSASRDRRQSGGLPSPLCRARFVSDLAPVLMVLDASLVLISPRGTRQIALRDFYLPDGIDRNRLEKNEIITQIRIKAPGPSRGVHYEKLRIRNAIDFPSLGVAVALDDTPARGKRLNICLTGVHTHPVHLEYFEDGKPWDATLETAIAQATSQAVPVKQDFFPPTYRRKMIAVLIRRGLRKMGDW